VPPLYDAHCHFHFEPLAPHRAAIDTELRALGLRAAVVNGTNEEEWPIVAALSQTYPWVRPSFGIHPWDCGNRSADWLKKLRAALLAAPAAAVGEIGLDRFILGLKPDDPRVAGLRVAPLEEQCEVCAAQLALAAELDRPAAIHCVQAHGALLDLLKSTPLPRCGFLLHGYRGSAEMMKSYADLGAHFSWNLEGLAPRAEAMREVFRLIPADRLLVETDAPTKAPPPNRNRWPLGDTPDGDAINHPANILVSYETLAELRSLPLESLAIQVERNFRTLFATRDLTPA
jgi:TatD DNase family protein